MFGVRRSSGYMTSLHQSLLSIKVDRSANIAEWLLKLQNVILLGPKTTSHSWWQANTGTHRHFTFAPCCHSNETHAPITNLPNSAQLGGTPYHSPKWHPGLCSSVEMWQGTHTHTHTHTPWHTDRCTWPIYILRRLQLTQNVNISETSMTIDGGGQVNCTQLLNECNGTELQFQH